MEDSAVDCTLNIDGRKLQCPECHRRFIRPEHMRRHLRNHDTSKRYTCHICNKQFVRRFRLPCSSSFGLFNMHCADIAFSDILSKHRSAHDADPLEVPVQPLSNGSALRKSRACYACAKAREKCTKGLPCTRCSRRCLDCVYPGSQQQDKFDHHSFGENTIASKPPNTENISAADLISPGTLRENLEDISRNGDNLTALMFDQIHSLPDEASDPSTRRYTTTGETAPWTPIAGCPTSDTQLSSILASGHSGSALWPFRNDELEPGVETLNRPINWLPFDESIDLNFGSTLDETVLLSPFGDTQWPTINTSTTANGLLEGQLWNLDIPPLADINDENSDGASRNISIPDISSPKGSISSNYKQGDLYATSSNGARNACSARAKRDDIFPDIERIGPLEDGICNPPMAISDLTYNTILQHFDNICLQMQSRMPCYETQSFPPLSLLNLFVKLYFKFFDPILPFIHLPSLDVNKSCVLTIAIAAVGSHYFQSRELTACSSQLHELCRRLLQQEPEHSEEEMTDLLVLQARILNHIGLCYSESKKPGSVVISNWSFTSSLINSQSRKRFLEYLNDRVMKPNDWDEWVEAESWRRLYFTARV